MEKTKYKWTQDKRWYDKKKKGHISFGGIMRDEKGETLTAYNTLKNTCLLFLGATLAIQDGTRIVIQY